MTNTDERKYAVRYGGHFSRGPLPTRFDMTLAEAEAAAHEWSVRADTIGGVGEVMEKPQ